MAAKCALRPRYSLALRAIILSCMHACSPAAAAPAVQRWAQYCRECAHCRPPWAAQRPGSRLVCLTRPSYLHPGYLPNEGQLQAHGCPAAHPWHGQCLCFVCCPTLPRLLARSPHVAVTSAAAASESGRPTAPPAPPLACLVRWRHAGSCPGAHASDPCAGLSAWGAITGPSLGLSQQAARRRPRSGPPCLQQPSSTRRRHLR
jgi:hypothetical protein